MVEPRSLVNLFESPKKKSVIYAAEGKTFVELGNRQLTRYEKYLQPSIIKFNIQRYI